MRACRLSLKKQRAAVSLLLVLLLSVLIFVYVAMQIRLGGEQTAAQVSYSQSRKLLAMLDSALERSAYRYKSTACSSMVESAVSFESGSISVDSATVQGSTCVLKISAMLGDFSRSIEIGLTSSAGASAWAVGKRASLQTRINGVWQLSSTSYSDDFNDIFCFDVTNCWLAGAADALAWLNAGVWTAFNPTSGENYYAIACLAVDDCFVSGSNSGGDFIRHWNGSDWNSISYFSAPLRDIQCPNTVCYAVGDGGLLLRYNGSWNSESSAISSNFYALACSSDSQCWAVTDNDKKNFVVAYRNASATWQQVMLSNTSAKTLRSIACSNSRCWAGGDNGEVIYYNGASWSYYGKIDSHAIYGISCRDSDNNCVAVGNNGSVSLYNGASWGAETSVTNHALNAVAFFDASASSSIALGLWRESY